LPQGAARTLAAGTLGPGTHVVEVRREGKGELFYTATLSYLERGEDLPPQDAARFKVRRSHSRLVPEVRPGGLWGWSRRDLKGLRPGDHVLVEVEVEASDDQEQFMLEDPFPSGFEWTQALDSAQVGEWGTSWRGSPYDGREVKDDRVALFASRLRAGRHVWRHVLRAEAPGRLHVLPAAAQLAYFPDIRASSQEGRLEVGE